MNEKIMTMEEYTQIKEYIRYCLDYGLAEAVDYEFSKDNPIDSAEMAEDLVELDIRYISNEEQWKSLYMDRFDTSDESDDTGFAGEGYYDFVTTCNGEYLDKIDDIMGWGLHLEDGKEKHKRLVSDEEVAEFFNKVKDRLIQKGDYKKKLSIEQYKRKMESKYSKELELLNNHLLMAGSFSRGRLLHDLLYNPNDVVKSECKYYIFLDWWSGIDSYHDRFLAEDIQIWIREAGVELDLSSLQFDDDGWAIVYRGINECMNRHGKSWTTSKDVAIKFARGVRGRGVAQHPKLLTARVPEFHILAIINDREEHEVLCYLTDIIKTEDVEVIDYNC